MRQAILFGTIPKQGEVYLCPLENKNGLRVEIITYGAIIKSICIPDRKNNRVDIVLGQDTLQDYLSNPSCSGAVIGRVANRISGGAYYLDKEEYHLEKNDRGNCLHSGIGNYGNKNFKIEDYNGNSVVLGLYEKEDERFPGDLKIWVRYILTEENELKIEYSACPSRQTILNLTNHCYFNLSGHGKQDVLENKITIHADYYTPTDAKCIPTGEILKVENTPLDLRKGKTVRKALEDLEASPMYYGGFDHNYVLRERGISFAAEVYDPLSGRKMEVYTDAPGMQFYTANHLNGKAENKEKRRYGRYCAYCFETQYYPDAIHYPHFPTTIVEKDKLWKSTTVFRFLYQ